MAATKPVPTLPGVSEAQVLEALEIVRRVYAEHGVTATIEPRIYRDPEIRDWVTVDIHGTVEGAPEMATMLALVRQVPTALADAGLYFPDVPITTYFDAG